MKVQPTKLLGILGELGLENSVEVQLSNKGTNLYIFFGGIAAGIAMPPFEFYNASGILDEHKIFIRDFNQNWYQSGLSLSVRLPVAFKI